MPVLDYPHIHKATVELARSAVLAAQFRLPS